jgi:ParB family transcriptional regulator, chromosome partitioning protein
MAQATENAIKTIPLSQLVPAPEGVRKQRNKAFEAELAASIKTHGLKQNLVVRKEGKKFAVIAGTQRLAAMNALVKAGDLKASFPVPCMIETSGRNAEISLVENAVRDDMHPADLFLAFRGLVDKGESVTDIAARFGRSETSVQKLLKLARVSPGILKAYRAGELNLEQVQAFAISDDTKAQERVHKALPKDGWRTGPERIREALTEHEIPVDDERVRFVTLKAYENDGGKVRENLFAQLDPSEDEDSGVGPSAFIENHELLDKLVTEKLQHVVQSIAGEGWKWVEARQEFNLYSGEFQRLTEQRSAGKARWQAVQKAVAGAIVTIAQSGKAEIHRGLVKPEDHAAAKKTERAAKAAAGKPGGSGELEASGLSAALVEQLTAHKSAALAAKVLQQPKVALAAVVHTLACVVLQQGYRDGIPLRIKPDSQSLQRVDGSKAQAEIESARKEWKQALGDPEVERDFEAKLWTWCAAQGVDELLRLLAFCAAATVDAVEFGGHRDDDPRIEQADRLAQAAKLDMREYFTTNAESYFSRVGRAQILEALAEVTGGNVLPAWSKMKKGELAKVAEQEIAGKGWLPDILRIR